MTIEHSEIGAVSPLLERWRARKTWRHFHSPTERWSLLAGVDTDRLRNAAPTYGCPAWRVDGDYPNLRRECEQRLLREHDGTWQKVYERELSRPDTRCGASRWDDNALLLVSPTAVYAVVSRAGPRYLRSVYRPHPIGTNVILTEPQRAEHTWDWWERETRMKVPNRREALAREVRDAGDVWLLARAIASCDPSADGADAPELVRARHRLEAVDPALRKQASPSADALSDRLAGALEEPDAVDALMEIEDALAVLEVLSGTVAAQAVLEQLRGLLEWAPESWSAVVPVAAARLAETSGVACAFWNAVEESVVGAVVHAANPARLEVASLVESVLPAPWWAPWAARLRAIPHAVARPIADLPDMHLGVAHLGGGPDDAWEFGAPRSWVAPGARLFVVDEEFGTGREVTLEAMRGEPIWRLEQPGQVARVVVVRGAEGGSLGALLVAAKASSDAVVEYVEVSRPS